VFRWDDDGDLARADGDVLPAVGAGEDDGDVEALLAGGVGGHRPTPNRNISQRPTVKPQRNMLI
jgi:hypothetical protein